MTNEVLGTSFIGIHQSFAATEHGQTLAANVRYERYKPAEMTNERWEGLLGADVNNLAHMRLTYGLTERMVYHLRESQPGFLAAHEEDVLQIAALIHDWGEAITGDISYGDKTAEDESQEMEHLSALLEQHYQSDTTGIKALVVEAAGVVRDPRGENGKLGHIFNTVERIGYMRTALRSAQHVIEGTAPDCAEGLRWIVADVFGNHPAELIERSGIYLPLQTYLRRQSTAITAAFGIVGHDTFANYPPEQEAAKKLAFQQNQRSWRNWLVSSGLAA